MKPEEIKRLEEIEGRVMENIDKKLAKLREELKTTVRMAIIASSRKEQK